MGILPETLFGLGLGAIGFLLGHSIGYRSALRDIREEIDNVAQRDENRHEIGK